VLDHNLFGFALPDIGAHEYFVYGATIQGQPRLGASLSFRVDGQPFQGNPLGISVMFLGTPFQGVAVFTPPYGNAMVWNPPNGIDSLATFLTGTVLSLQLPDDANLLGVGFGLQALTLQLSNIGTGNWTAPFFGVLGP
jgi:hypothetical protein